MNRAVLAAAAAAATSAATAGAGSPFLTPADSRFSDSPTDSPRLPLSTAGHALSPTLDRALASPSRGVSALRGGAQIVMNDPLESLSLLPASLNGQFSNPTWTPDGAGSFTRWESASTTYAGVVANSVAGNATRKIRYITGVANNPGGAFIAGEANFLDDAAQGVRFLFGPDASGPARLEHDVFVGALSTAWTSDAVADLSGLITSRLLWGGSHQAGGGLPATNALDRFFAFGPGVGSFTQGRFYECRYAGSAPTGESIGSPAEVPLGAWFRLIHEVTASSEIVVRINLNDGTGEHEIYRGPFSFGTVIDEYQTLSSFEGLSDFIYVDNLRASGVKLETPIPPLLQCDYLDDIEWMNVGSISIQSERWFSAISARTVVVPTGPSGQRLRQRNNVSSDSYYRREFSTELPEAYAYDVHDVVVCADLLTSFFNVTVRGFAPVDDLGLNIAARVLIGRDDGVMIDNFVYVQINEDYDPIDDEDALDPYFPGPDGNGRVPIINFDVVNTGYAWPNNSTRTLCTRIEPDGSLAVTIDGVEIAGGGTGIAVDAFATSVSELRFESENNIGGPGDDLFVDNVTVECEPLPTVQLPDLELVYEDDLEWGSAGVSIEAFDDDANPFTPFRWSSAGATPLIQTAGPDGQQTLALRMENIEQDGAPPSPFAQEVVAYTEMPAVIASPTRGWIAGADLRLTDTRTTRFINVSKESVTPGAFVIDTSVAIESATQLIWVLDGDGLGGGQWVNTGTTLLALGIQPNDWFTLAFRRNLNGQFGFLIDGRPLRDSLAQPVFVDPLQTPENGVHEDLERMSFGSQNEDLNGSPGSSLDVARVFAWALPCEGDANLDGETNFSDLNAVLVSFGATGDLPANLAPDSNGDGLPDDNVVNFTDLNAVLVGFGQTCD